MADRDQAANGPPDITVVVPVKNRRVMLADLLHGLRQQTLRSAGFELLVLDNQSQDDIEGLVRDFAASVPFSVRYECMEEDHGPVPARNRGARYGNGAVVAFLDSDCRPTPDWLQAALQEFADPNVAFVTGPVTYKPEQVATFFGKRTAESLVEHPTYSTQNIFYRRDLFLSFGGFDENLSVKDFLHRSVECADTDLAWRLKEAGWANRFATGALVYHEIEQQPVFYWLMEPTRLLLLPLLIKLHPELAKKLLSWNVVFYRGTVFIYLGVILITLILLIDCRLIAIPTVAFAFLVVHRTGSLSPRRLAKTAGKTLLNWTRTAILAITLLVGSVRYRRLVI
jgi:glycosyltransferase involved in cell wall biosynthesis